MSRKSVAASRSEDDVGDAVIETGAPACVRLTVDSKEVMVGIRKYP